MNTLTGYETKHFALHELLPEYEYSTLPERTGWGLLDPRLLWTIDQLRERFGSAYINNWKWGGGNQFRGLRPFSCPIGAPFSAHKFGRAVDMTFAHATAEEVRSHILQHPQDEVYQFITCIEMKVIWLHIDTRNYNTQNGILKIYP